MAGSRQSKLVRYAAYGSNLHPMRLQARVPNARFLGTAFHAGFGLRFHKRSLDQSGKCNIDSSATGVHFAVYEMSIADKCVLDDIEGVGRGYADGAVDLRQYGKCAAYIAEDSHIDDRLAPYDWYRELVLLGCRRLGFPDDYQAGVAGIEAIADPDAERNWLNRQLIERIRRDL